ncbi:Hypothetical protein PBC10988_30410 [Planctomycetales bacterium 10988]|nr:Hypothetical protein PBC10988_30410 [Planctomycetales bacterium 10988]
MLSKAWGRGKSEETFLQLERLESRCLLDAVPLLIDLVPGGGHSSPEEFAEVNGTLFFSTDAGGFNWELWKSDGTAPGTQLVKDIYEGGGASSPYGLTNVNGTLFFRAFQLSTGFELWRSDGTSAGTQLVKDLPGESLSPTSLTNVNGTLLFVGDDASYGGELWRSDGTSNGTVLVRDIFSGTSDSDPRDLTNINGTLYFSASNNAVGRELWRSDGTFSGTQLVADLTPSGSSDLRRLTNVNGTLFFYGPTDGAGGELWKSDGSFLGTQIVKELDPMGSFSAAPYDLTNVNGTLFFRATTDSYGFELWRSDGTYAGTSLIRDIRPGDDGSSPRQETFVNVNGTLFFTANNGGNGYELWRSDGTFGGTFLVKDINPGSDPSLPLELMNAAGTLFFTANQDSTGRELWISDGTYNGTQLVKDLAPGFESGEIEEMTNVNGTLFFHGDDNSYGSELWVVRDVEPGGLIVTGTDSGTAGAVRTFNGVGSELLSFFPYTEAFTGGVRIATGDINGDGILDIVTAAGPGGGPHVQVFNSITGSHLFGSPNNFYAYAPNVTVGLFVAVGDVNNDGFDDIITSADAGGGPHIKVFSGQTGGVITEFYAYAPNVTVGVRIAAGDIDGNGTAEIITSPGPGGGPHIRVFSGTTGAQMPGPATNFYAYAPNVLTGIYVASGDVNNDGLDDIITSPGAGGGPHVQVFSSADGSHLQNFYAYHPNFTGGVRVGAADLNLDGHADILTVPGSSGGPHTRAFDGTNLANLANFFSGSPGNLSGLFVTGSVGLIPVENAAPLSAPFTLPSTTSAMSSPSEDSQAPLPLETWQPKKAWFEEVDRFYQRTEGVDSLFSGLGIKESG